MVPVVQVVDSDATECDSCGATFVQEKEKKSLNTYMIVGGLFLAFIGLVGLFNDNLAIGSFFFIGDIILLVGVISNVKTSANKNDTNNNLSFDLEEFKNELKNFN